MIKGNQSWFEAQQDMKKDIGAMKDLGFNDKQIGTIFDRRNLGRDFNALRANKFKPFEIPDEVLKDWKKIGYKGKKNEEKWNKHKADCLYTYLRWAVITVGKVHG